MIKVKVGKDTVPAKKQKLSLLLTFKCDAATLMRVDGITCGTGYIPSQVKSQAGCRRDPAIPTWDPGWEWRDPALVGGIPPFPPGTQM